MLRNASVGSDRQLFMKAKKLEGVYEAARRAGVLLVMLLDVNGDD